MTDLETAAADYANAHRAWAVATGQTFNIEAATAYATKDVMVQKPIEILHDREGFKVLDDLYKRLNTV